MRKGNGSEQVVWPSEDQHADWERGQVKDVGRTHRPRSRTLKEAAGPGREA